MIEIIDHIEPPAQVVRLQVWHLDKLGRAKAVNRELSDYLAQTTLFSDWTITPAPAESTRDHYVPIEVDLTFCRTGNPDQESGDVSLRFLFNSTLHTEIQSFFSHRKTKPIQMNVFPMGQKLTDDTKKNFTHFYLFFSLAVDSSIAVEESVSVERDGLTEAVRIAGCALNTCAALKDNGVDINKMSKDVLEGNKTVGELWTSVKENMSKTPLGQEVGRSFDYTSICLVSITIHRQITKQYGNDESSNEKDLAEIKKRWQKSLESFELFLSLSNQIQTCVVNITRGEQKVRKKFISP
jgi:hypothetical protein